MKLTSESKFFIGIIAATAFIVIAAVILLSQPQKPIAKNELITQMTNTIGNKDARVWLVEFSDFQCPACHAFANTIDELALAHKDDLLIAYRHFPLPQHPLAQKTAIAAEAAGAQGKFWDMEKLLFDNQESISDQTIASLAASLSLNMTQFTKDNADPALKTLVINDKQYGEQLGLTATPTFFLNGVKLEVASPDELKKKVENALSINTN